jgi:hypothetical protein
MKRTVPQTLAECQTDEQRADYLVKHDVFESDEFKYEGVAEPPRRRLMQQLHMRIDEETIARLRKVADSKRMGYQTLARMWLIERLEQEDV